MKLLRSLLLTALACTAPALVLAQWQWIDGAGRKVFSDQPPPPEVPPRNILRQPGVRSAAPVVVTPADAPSPAAAAAPAPARAASGPAVARQDKELEARRKQLEAAEAEKRKAEEERIAKLRADNCARVQQAKRTLDSGVRVARMNAKGETEVMDDAARGAETLRLQGLLASECKAP